MSSLLRHPTIAILRIFITSIIQFSLITTIIFLVIFQTTVGVARAETALPSGKYVALGDSYASGFGVAPYEEGTHISGGNGCQRSTSAYAHQIGSGINRDLDFRACKGATTTDFYRPNTSWHEPAQLDNINNNTALVTFSIGGNDAGFSEVIRDCIDGWELLPFNTCYSDERITARVDSALDTLRGTGSRNDTFSYDKIFDDIHSRAPNAKVIAVGYPHFFPAGGASNNSVFLERCQGIKKIDQRWMVEKIDEINNILEDAALRHGYQFTNPTASFEGHELCSNDPWFYGLASAGRFHPTETGHMATADDILETIKNSPAQAPVPSALNYNTTEDDSDISSSYSRPIGATLVTRSGNQLILDASSSTDADGTIKTIDWYVEREGSEEVLQGARASVVIPGNEPVSVTAAITDNHGLTDFVSKVIPAVSTDPTHGGTFFIQGTSTMPISSIDTSTLTNDSGAVTTQVRDVNTDGIEDLLVTTSTTEAPSLCISGRITDGSGLNVCVLPDK